MEWTKNVAGQHTSHNGTTYLANCLTVENINTKDTEYWSE